MWSLWDKTLKLLKNKIIEEYNDSNDRLLSKGLLEARKHSENPILKNIQSGIYKAITVGGENAPPDPEGRGRIPAYIPKLNGDPKEPMYFQYASPYGANAQGSYGMFSVPPDMGVTILVFFADNGEITEGYWFAVAQEVPSITWRWNC